MGTRNGAGENSGRKAVFENVATIWKRRINEIASRTNAPEFTTGITMLDNLTHGFRKGELSFIAARTSEGKTAFALQAAMKNADLGKTVAFISLEDSREDLVERVFCNIAQVDNYDIVRGGVPRERLEDPAILKIFENLKLLVLDRFGYTIDEMKYVVEELDPQPDLIFIDYIQAIDAQGGNRYEALNRFAEQARAYTLQSGIGVVLLSQINRAGAREERPSLIHLSGSDVLEQRADKAFIIFQPHIYGKPSFDFKQGDAGGKRVTIAGYEEAPKNWIEIEVAKNKNGIRGCIVPAKFTGKHYSFSDWDGEAE